MDKKRFGLLYGLVLIFVGIALFFRAPQVLTEIASIEYFAAKLGVIRFCLYALGTFLVAAGALRIYKNA